MSRLSHLSSVCRSSFIIIIMDFDDFDIGLLIIPDVTEDGLLERSRQLREECRAPGEIFLTIFNRLTIAVPGAFSSQTVVCDFSVCR